MSEPDDPVSFDAEFGDPDYVKAARDPNLPPETGPEWEPGGRAADAPIVNGGGRSPFTDLNDESETTAPGGDPNPPVPGTPMVEHALYYARRSWPVFPCKPTDKSPYIKGGFHAATTDEENDPQMVGLLAKSHDRRANGVTVRRLGGRSRSAREAGGA